MELRVVRRISEFRIIEIEMFSYCNRQCAWCPNKYIDRHSDCKVIDFDVLEKLVKELKLHNYKGVFSFSRYNEPLSHLDALNQGITIIKKYLPDCKLVSNTNGDYLTRQTLEDMLIDELTVMDYDRLGEDKVYKRMVDLGITDIQKDNQFYLGKYKNKTILYYCSWLDYATICDRGGNLSEYSKEARVKPCAEPLYFLGINYDGTVSPCPNVRNDCSNRSFILGDLHKNSLSELLQGKEYQEFLYNVSTGKFTEDMPCYYCKTPCGRYSRDNAGIQYGVGCYASLN